MNRPPVSRGVIDDKVNSVDDDKGPTIVNETRNTVTVNVSLGRHTEKEKVVTVT